MARLLPDAPLGFATAEALRVYRLCRELPEGWIVWQNLAGSEPAAFWIVHEKDWRGLLLLVSPARNSEAQGPELFREGAEPFGAREKAWMAAARESYAGTMIAAAQVMLFPDVPQGFLDGHFDFPAGGREICRPRGFLSWIEAHLGPDSRPADVQMVRERFCPETVIPPEHTAKLPEPGTTVPALLTYRQEELLKTDLDLSPEARQTAGEFDLLVVNGVAGSGKSLILLHRALLLQQFFPRHHVLVLTCNKPLQTDLRRRFRRLGGNGRTVEWFTFHAFCRRYWTGEKREIIERSQKKRRLEDLLLKFRDDRLERRHLEEEFTWIFEQGFADCDSCLAAVRRGRGFRAPEALRRRLWEAAQSYRASLDRDHLIDWGLLPLELRKLWAAKGAQFPRFDAVLIDEAQFFAPVWFDIVRRVLQPEGHLFLAADPTQGFLQRGASWKSLGLKVNGRTRRLERSHRTTKQILETAWRFWHARNRTEDPDIVVPRIEDMADGEPPRLVCFENAADELSWLVREAAAFVQGGGMPQHLLILHEDWQALRELRTRLSGVLGDDRVADAREDSENAVRLCSLNAATGLESPVVFVGGTARLFGRENSPLADRDARDIAAQETTGKLYMAFTRAGQRLVVTCAGTPPGSLRTAFDV